MVKVKITTDDKLIIAEDYTLELSILSCLSGGFATIIILLNLFGIGTFNVFFLCTVSALVCFIIHYMRSQLAIITENAINGAVLLNQELTETKNDEA
jgi:hypothetical protein